MATYVKCTGKALAAESVNAILHEILKPLVISNVEALRIINLEKPIKSMAKITEKLKGSSD